ncbi:MAG: hypothetical protein HY854_04980 [Burkholderiales bacterium]|nr:hypothetical protein [Burkholderiales bacterium]
MTAATLARSREAAASLNAGCFCASLDAGRLRAALESEIGSPEVFALVQERCPHMFAARPVFVSPVHLEEMASVIAAVESVTKLAAYRRLVLDRSPAIARHDPGAAGAFFGYDFHATAGGLGLIEVNTNAGGAMLNSVLARAHLACCTPVEELGPDIAAAERFEEAILEMFFSEWRLAGRAARPRTIAIVDEAPAAQYLYPEFLLFQRLFERYGIRAFVADPAELQWANDGLMLHDTRIDLVYNRLTDFYFDDPRHAAIRSAYLAGAAVVTPHPRAHALLADKRNLALLSDAATLDGLGVSGATRAALLDGIPRTIVVDSGNAPELWAQRKQYFFKPFAGYGGKAAYRGDKVTQRVWQEISAGGYVAQQVVAPGERSISGDEERPLKFDLRNYVYQGEVQWVAARLYQGQTTNFRTPGGGFAPVYVSPL